MCGSSRTVTGMMRIPSGRRMGNWIVFTSSRKGFKDEAMLNEWGPQPYGDLYVMHADGSDVRQLTDNQFEEATAAWRPEPGTHSAWSGR